MFVGLVHARANEHRPQQQETMTNRVRRLVRTQKGVEGYLRARDVREVRAFRTTERLVVLGRIPLRVTSGIGRRGPGLS